MLYQLRGVEVLSNINLRFGYHQVRIKDEKIHKTTLRTKYGHYELVVMSFGINKHPNIVHVFNEQCFKSVFGQVCIFFSMTYWFIQRLRSMKNI